MTYCIEALTPTGWVVVRSPSGRDFYVTLEEAEEARRKDPYRQTRVAPYRGAVPG